MKKETSKIKIIKRNGNKEEFNPEKIKIAIRKSAERVMIKLTPEAEDEVVKIAEHLASQGHRVITAGLDMDFRGRPFRPIPELLSVSEIVTKLQAVCAVCGASSSRTQRLIDGNPAKIDDPIILVGANESYEPRCRAHHVVAPSDNDKEEL